MILEKCTIEGDVEQLSEFLKLLHISAKARKSIPSMTCQGDKNGDGKMDEVGGGAVSQEHKKAQKDRTSKVIGDQT
jgi:hypothetical protein